MKKIVCILVLSILMISCNHVDGNDLAQEALNLYSEGDYQLCVDKGIEALNFELSNEKNLDVLMIIGNAYTQLNEFEKALEYQRKALELEPASAAIWVNMAVAHRQAGDFKSAEHCYNEASDIDPEYYGIHVGLGSLYIQLERFDEAIECLTYAIYLKPEETTGYANLAVAYAHMGDVEMAKSCLNVAENHNYYKIDELKELVSSLLD